MEMNDRTRKKRDQTLYSTGKSVIHNLIEFVGTDTFTKAAVNIFNRKKTIYEELYNEIVHIDQSIDK